jgi:hypothetical protein
MAKCKAIAARSAMTKIKFDDGAMINSVLHCDIGWIQATTISEPKGPSLPAVKIVAPGRGYT